MPTDRRTEMNERCVEKSLSCVFVLFSNVGVTSSSQEHFSRYESNAQIVRIFLATALVLQLAVNPRRHMQRNATPLVLAHLRCAVTTRSGGERVEWNQRKSVKSVRTVYVLFFVHFILIFGILNYFIKLNHSVN